MSLSVILFAAIVCIVYAQKKTDTGMTTTATGGDGGVCPQGTIVSCVVKKEGCEDFSFSDQKEVPCECYGQVQPCAKDSNCTFQLDAKDKQKCEDTGCSAEQCSAATLIVSAFVMLLSFLVAM